MLLFLACRNPQHQPAEERAVTVVAREVKENSVSRDISVSGNIEGDRTVKLGFMVAGKISRIVPSEGQTVGRGQLIATLDDTNYSIAREMADVQVSQATDEYNRLKLMYERNSISESDFKKIDFTLQSAKAQLKLQSKNLADTKLYAPFSGVLLKKLAEPGEIVSAGMPVLVLSDISKVKVNAYIPENQVDQIRMGQEAEVKVNALGESFTGKLTELGAAADLTTRAFTVRIEVANPGLKIRPGMIAEVSIPSTRNQSVISVPASAILRTPEGQSYLFVADNGKAFQRNISVGNLYGDEIEIVSGLSAGEKIIVAGQHKLTNGTRISVTDKQAP